MASPEAALRVCHQFVPDATPSPHPILLPNSNSPVDNAIGYSTVVGDLAGDADLMNVFRNHNRFPHPRSLLQLSPQYVFAKCLLSDFPVSHFSALVACYGEEQGCNCGRGRVPDTVRKAGNIPAVAP